MLSRLYSSPFVRPRGGRTNGRKKRGLPPGKAQPFRTSSGAAARNGFVRVGNREEVRQLFFTPSTRSHGGGPKKSPNSRPRLKRRAESKPRKNSVAAPKPEWPPQALSARQSLSRPGQARSPARLSQFRQLFDVRLNIFLVALRTDAVAEGRFGMIGDITVDLLPVVVIVTNLLAIRADWQ